MYVGLAERNGSAVVCLRCKGTGAVEYVPPVVVEFKGRRVRERVKTVHAADSGYVLVPSIDAGEISYDEFLAGKMPGEVVIKPKAEWDKAVSR